jgi:nucleoside-diphosphate-sugar epimerase
VSERRVFLTGPTGFVGSHVARALCAEGWSVRALTRTPDRIQAAGLGDLPLEPAVGDLSEASLATLREALRGCQAVVHVAGLVKARSLEEYREINVRATDRLLAAAGEAAPEALFLLVSSQAAAGPAIAGRPVREADTARPVSWYGRSKLEAEQAVARTWRGPWVVLRPAAVYGPADRGLLSLFRAAARGWIPVPAGSSRIQVAYAPQAALAIARAAARPDLSGRIGFLCDPEPVTVRDFASRLSRLPDRPARLVPIPDSAVRLAAAVESLRGAITGRSRPFNADKAREILAGHWLCDSTPMGRDLGLPPPYPLEDGLRETWNWYKRLGWLEL